MKNFFKLVALLFFVGFPCLAKPAHVNPGDPGSLYDLPIKKGAMIRIDKYDPKLNCYEVTIPAEEAIGPNVSPKEDLLKSIRSLDPVRVNRDPSGIVGNEYTLDSDLPRLSKRGRATRRRTIKSSKHRGQ